MIVYIEDLGFKLNEGKRFDTKFKVDHSNTNLPTN